MEIRILGPLEIVDGDYALALPGPRQRGLLALLALHANEVVSSERLIDELWPGEPPGSAAAALQAGISRLRKALGDNAKVVATVAPGYVLRLDADQLDVRRFEQLVEDSAGMDPEAAAETLRNALALWRGTPLADLAYESFAQAPIRRLEELRLVALEQRISADLALGRHAQLVPELEALLAEHPLREGLRAQIMLAQYRAGRQAEALEQYQRARRTLVDELGIEPSPALQELEKAILQHDPSLDLDPSPKPPRSILVVGLGDDELEPLLRVAEPLARKPARELILARLLGNPEGLTATTAALRKHSDSLAAQGIVARVAVFTSATPAADAARLASEQDVDLVLVAARTDLLADSELATLLRVAPCDVAVLTEPVEAAGPVLVPFAGTEHDWSAIELGAWLAGNWNVPLRLAGPAAESGRDASRLLASASLVLQRALGVAAEPLLVEPGPERLVAAARDAAVSVVGLPERWRKEGLGAARAALAASGQPTLLVRKGLRPGGLAPPENLTRFTWSLRS
jgi:DNA-binding SARP family transcriptional activator